MAFFNSNTATENTAEAFGSDSAGSQRHAAVPGLLCVLLELPLLKGRVLGPGPFRFLWKPGDRCSVPRENTEAAYSGKLSAKAMSGGSITISNVGSIGGVEYKIKGAEKKGADIFFVPRGENYEEAKKIVEEEHYKIKLIPVSTFEEALNYLLENVEE